MKIDDFINNAVYSDFTKFEIKDGAFFIYPDKEKRENDYYKFDLIDLNQKTIYNIGYHFDNGIKKAVGIVKENGYFLIKRVAKVKNVRM